MLCWVISIWNWENMRKLPHATISICVLQDLVALRIFRLTMLTSCLLIIAGIAPSLRTLQSGQLTLMMVKTVLFIMAHLFGRTHSIIRLLLVMLSHISPWQSTTQWVRRQTSPHLMVITTMELREPALSMLTTQWRISSIARRHRTSRLFPRRLTVTLPVVPSTTITPSR